MGTVTGLTAERMLAIEDATVVSGNVDPSGFLVLVTHGGTEVNAGNIVDAMPSATESAAGVVELATNVEVGAGVDTVRVVTPAGLASLIATATVRGLVELATNAETSNGTDDTRAVTPASLASVIATATARGLVELATNAEVATGTDTSRAVTPAGLASLVASDTAKGIVELANNTETSTGTDTTRAVTPAALASVLSGKQASDSDLTAIAGLTPADNDVIQRKSGVWVNRTMAQLATDLASTNELVEIRLHNGTSYVDADAFIYIGTVEPASATNGTIWLDTTP